MIYPPISRYVNTENARRQLRENGGAILYDNREAEQLDQHLFHLARKHNRPRVGGDDRPHTESRALWERWAEAQDMAERWLRVWDGSDCGYGGGHLAIVKQEPLDELLGIATLGFSAGSSSAPMRTSVALRLGAPTALTLARRQ